jgi:hypothetical protein
MQGQRRQWFMGMAGVVISGALALGSSAALAQAKPLAGQTVKIVRIDPLSGLMGPVGRTSRRTTSSSPRSSARRAIRPA